MEAHAKRSYTAEGVAALRAVGARERIADLRNPDQYAERFLGGWMRWVVPVAPIRSLANRVMQRRLPGIYPFVTARTKYFDAALNTEVAAGAQQVVILGAGADSRAHRFADRLAETSVFELDHPATSEWKRAKVARLDLPGKAVHVPIDFGSTSLAETLDANKVDRDLATLFLWEGVSPYLEAEAVAATLTEIARFAEGSSVVFDYVYRDGLDAASTNPDAAKYREYLSGHGEPLRFGIDPERLAEYLDGFGLSLADHATPADLRRELLGDLRDPMSFSAIAHARVGRRSTEAD